VPITTWACWTPIDLLTARAAQRLHVVDLTGEEDFELPTLHELVRDAAEAGNVLTEETADLDLGVTFPEDLDATLKARLEGWYERVKATVWPPAG
jgi:hypothetical protein